MGRPLSKSSIFEVPSVKFMQLDLVSSVMFIPLFKASSKELISFLDEILSTFLLRLMILARASVRES